MKQRCMCYFTYYFFDLWNFMSSTQVLSLEIPSWRWIHKHFIKEHSVRRVHCGSLLMTHVWPRFRWDPLSPSCRTSLSDDWWLHEWEKLLSFHPEFILSDARKSTWRHCLRSSQTPAVMGGSCIPKAYPSRGQRRRIREGQWLQSGLKRPGWQRATPPRLTVLEAAPTVFSTLVISRWISWFLIQMLTD